MKVYINVPESTGRNVKRSDLKYAGIIVSIFMLEIIDLLSIIAKTLLPNIYKIQAVTLAFKSLVNEVKISGDLFARKYICQININSTINQLTAFSLVNAPSKNKIELKIKK